MEKLKDVWKLSARTANDHLNTEEFYIAMRLIAYLQNGMRCDEEYIVMNMNVALPTFEGVQGATDIWRITAEDMGNYEKIIQHFDNRQSGYLTDEDMQNVM